MTKRTKRTRIPKKSLKRSHKRRSRKRRSQKGGYKFVNNTKKTVNLYKLVKKVKVKTPLTEEKLKRLIENEKISMKCPISLEYMVNPVKAADEKTYEKDAMLGLFAQAVANGVQPKSPMTNLPLGNTDLTEDKEMKTKIDKFNSLGEDDETRLSRLSSLIGKTGDTDSWDDPDDPDDPDSYILEEFDESTIHSGTKIEKVGDGGLEGNLVVRMPYTADDGFGGHTLILADLRGEHSLFAMIGAGLFKPDEEQKLMEIIKSGGTLNNALAALRMKEWNKDEAMKLLTHLDGLHPACDCSGCGGSARNPQR